MNTAVAEPARPEDVETLTKAVEKVFESVKRHPWDSGSLPLPTTDSTES